ncbi:hypothetical protein ACFE04_000493 [Oxalis oulophora]
MIVGIMVGLGLAKKFCVSGGQAQPTILFVGPPPTIPAVNIDHNLEYHRELQDFDNPNYVRNDEIGDDSGSVGHCSKTESTTEPRKYREESNDYKRVMRHAGSLMKTWRGRIKGKWYTKRLGTDDLWKVPEDKQANISKDDWHKYVKYCASAEGIKLSKDNRERGLKNECCALVRRKGMPDYEYNLVSSHIYIFQASSRSTKVYEIVVVFSEKDGVKDLSRNNVYLLARTDKDGNIKYDSTKKLKERVDDLNGQIARNELTLGPREDVGKAALTGWALTGGVTSTIGTFFGVGKQSDKLMTENDELRQRLEKAEKIIEQAKSQGFHSHEEIVHRDNLVQPKTVKKIKVESSQNRLDKGASKSKVMPRHSSDRGLPKSKVVPQISSDRGMSKMDDDIVSPRSNAQSKQRDDSGYQRANTSTGGKQNHSSTSRHSPTASEQRFTKVQYDVAFNRRPATSTIDNAFNATKGEFSYEYDEYPSSFRFF